jgi:CHAT domain-containing protein
VISTFFGCRAVRTPESVRDQIALEIRRGDLKAASRDVDQALLQYGGKSPEWAWRFRIQKAHILASQSASADALGILGGDLPPAFASTDIAVRKNMLEGMAYRVAQDFRKSEEKLATAEELANRYQPQLLCEVLNFRGALEVDETKYPQAEATYSRALKLAREHGRPDQEASAQVSLALMATKRGRFDEAVERGQAARQLAHSLGMQGLESATLGNLGWNYYALGDFYNALSSYKEAAAASDRSGLTGYGFYWLTGVANSYRALHDPASAETILKQTIEKARQLGDTATVTECLNTLSEISLRAGRTEEAAQYNQEALKLEQAGLDHTGTFQSLVLSARIETNKQNFQVAETTLQRVLLDRGVETPLRWEAQARLAKLHDDAGLTKKAEQEYRQSIDTIEAARSAITQDELRVSFFSGGIEFYNDYVEFLIAHGRQGDALEIAELSRARTLEEGLHGSIHSTRLTSRNSQPFQSAQRLHATLLFYWLGEKHSYLWVITPVKMACLTLPATSEIDSAVKSYSEAVAGSEDVAETELAAGEKLYAMLVAPAEKFMAPNARVILLPDGSLFSLNFETLIAPAPKPHFWIEDVTLSTASSLSLLASGANRPPPKQKNLLLVGDALKASDEFEPLPQAEDEMQNVERYFPESNRMVLKREQATPGAYLASNPERYSYLHFVTHGTASRAQPLESAVILSKEPASDTYKLYARDIVTRHLNAELVTISACNGSGKRTYSGEGLVGLSWAFLRAGAHSVIGALWEVSNAPSTAQLMDSFYKGLSQGLDPATALREAKLSFLRSSDNSVFRKPYYWAPFQLYAGS